MPKLDFLSSDKIIHQVKEHPCIYDRSNDNYGRKEARLNAWFEVCENLACEYGQTFTRDAESMFMMEVQKRWKSLKDAYSRTLRYQNRETYGQKRPYIYSNCMSFMLPYLKVGCGLGIPQVDNDQCPFEDRSEHFEDSNTLDIKFQERNIDEEPTVPRKRKSYNIPEIRDNRTIKGISKKWRTNRKSFEVDVPKIERASTLFSWDQKDPLQITTERDLPRNMEYPDDIKPQIIIKEEPLDSDMYFSDDPSQADVNEDDMVDKSVEPSPSTSSDHLLTKATPIARGSTSLMESCHQIRQPILDEYEVLGLYVTCELRLLRSDERKRRLRRTIQRLIMAAVDEEHEEEQAERSNSHDVPTSSSS